MWACVFSPPLSPRFRVPRCARTAALAAAARDVGPPLLNGANPQHRAVGVTVGRGDPTEARSVIQPRTLRW